ncbi:ribosome silencing factor [Pseudochelatococcus lubricantis]|uniref:ribosome silencing factor n=1 Tax=Pseudochelatococcus lubricantis TaxID=1538102 RepID=UPI0035E51886
MLKCEDRALSQLSEYGAQPAPLNQTDGTRTAGETPPAGDAAGIARFQLEEMKAEEIVEIDLVGRTTIADTMFVASGRSDRHVGAIAEKVAAALKQAGFGPVRVEGFPACDWVLIDVGDIIVHIFRPEVRSFYNLEKIWSPDRPKEPRAG